MLRLVHRDPPRLSSNARVCSSSASPSAWLGRDHLDISDSPASTMSLERWRFTRSSTLSRLCQLPDASVTAVRDQISVDVPRSTYTATPYRPDSPSNRAPALSPASCYLFSAAGPPCGVDTRVQVPLCRYWIPTQGSALGIGASSQTLGVGCPATHPTTSTATVADPMHLELHIECTSTRRANIRHGQTMTLLHRRRWGRGRCKCNVRRVESRELPQQWRDSRWDAGDALWRSGVAGNMLSFPI